MRGLTRLLELGTAGYPAPVARRLKILNACGYLMAASSAGFAAMFALTDPAAYGWTIASDLLLVAIGLCVPLMHRVHELLASAMIAFFAPLAVFGEAAAIGREAGAQLSLIVGAAAAFFIFGLERPGWCLALVAECFALYLAAWLLFPTGLASASATAVGPAFVVALHLLSAASTFAMIAVLVYYAFRLAQRAEAETERILRNILPDAIVDRLRRDPDTSVAEAFEGVSVLFSDIQGFVSLSKRLGAERTVGLLNELFRGFDALAAKHGVEKIKTIGDAYMAVAGLPHAAPDHACRLARLALDMLKLKNEVAARSGLTIRMRIGIASGPVTAGIIGTRKFSYDVWGDAVNLAARLEATGEPERIQLSAEARDALAPFFRCERRGPVEIKGIGALDTWFLIGPRSEAEAEAAAPPLAAAAEAAAN